MPGRLKIKEPYRKDDDIIYFVVYDSTTGNGEDEVLQHQRMEIETAHITVHPDGLIKFHKKRSRTYLENAVRNNLAGYTPALSSKARKFIDKVRNKI